MKNKILAKVGLTFNDVSIIPSFSKILPTQVNTSTYLTKKIKLNVPILSAAMDTVTEKELAIALALQGGIGIIHRNLTPEEQAAQVKCVKRFESGFIIEPVVVSPNTPIKSLHNAMQNLNFGGFPVTKDGTPNGKFLGEINSRNFSIVKHGNLKVKDRMIPKDKVPTVAQGVTLEEANDILLEGGHKKLFILSKNGYLKAMVSRTDIEKNELFPNSCKDKHKRLRVGAAVGPGSDLEKRVKLLVAAGVDVIIVDTAHGHSTGVGDAIEYIKEHYDIEVIGGNIVTPEAAEFLISKGADAVKIGVGPGSICTTRIVAGVGIPQVTAVYECSEVADKHGVPLIADGSIKYSGDVAKAIAAGASCVMIGNLFAGTKEAPGELVRGDGGRIFKKYRGMGSVGAMMAGSKDRYFQQEIKEKVKLIPEGVEGLVPYRGEIKDVIYQLVGGLRQSMGYCGCATIDEMRRKAMLRIVSPATEKESHPSIRITKEAPNYPITDGVI